MNAISPVIERSRPAFERGGAIVDFLRKRLDPHDGCRENFHALFLDAHQRLVGEKTIRGDRAGSIRTRSRELFADALAARAHGLIIAHNHPSGRCEPSRADIEATRKLSDLARSLDIKLVDHLIITNTSAYSMRAGGLL